MFRYEYEMTEPVYNWLLSQGLLVRREFRVPWGICDLVGVKIDESKAQLRKSFKQYSTIGPIPRVALLNSIPNIENNTSISLKRLSKIFDGWLTDEKLQRELDFLIRKKFVVSIRKSHFQKLNGWMPLHDRFVAVELKLNRISEVLYQAVSNTGIFDESYVGLPRDTAFRAAESRRRHDFEEYGIGLLAVDKNSCEILIQPGPSKIKPDSILQAHTAESFWRLYLKEC